MNLFPIDIPRDNNISKRIFIIPFSSTLESIKFLGIEKYLHYMIMPNSTGFIRYLLLSPLLIAPWLTILSCSIWHKFRNLKNCVLLSLFASSALEIIQLFEIFLGVSRRLLDTNYIVLFTLGGSLGYIIFKTLHKLIFREV